MANREYANDGGDEDMTDVDRLPGGPIARMSPEEQDQVGMAIASAILVEVVDHGPSSIDSVLDGVSDRLAIPKNEMLYGLLYGEEKGIIAIDHRHFTVSPSQTIPGK